MSNSMKEVQFYIPLNYVSGYIRSGHKEGTLELTKEELKSLKQDPVKFVKESDLLGDLNLIIDSYSLEDYGDPTEVKYEVRNNV